MIVLLISYFTRNVAIASLALSIGMIFFQITVPFEVLKRLGIRPRDCNIYAHNVDTTLDLLLPPFGQIRNKPDFRGMGLELAHFAVITVIVFAIYIAGYWAFYAFKATHENATLIVSWNVPPRIVYEIFTQIFVIALPEELFYRGFLQSALLKKMPSHKRLSGWPLGAAIICTNLIFAFGHVASTLNPMRMLTFFPGILFSYFVLRHKSLLSAILFHAACNILGQILFASFYIR